jgi:hypothetical protein
MSEKKAVDKSGPKAQEKARSNYPGQEHETLRLGTPEALMAEKVVDARENSAALKKAKAARIATTGEPSKAPRFEDAKK